MLGRLHYYWGVMRWRKETCELATTVESGSSLSEPSTEVDSWFATEQFGSLGTPMTCEANFLSVEGVAGIYRRV